MAGYNQDVMDYLLSQQNQSGIDQRLGPAQMSPQQKQRLNALNSAARSHGIIKKPPTPYDYEAQNRAGSIIREMSPSPPVQFPTTIRRRMPAELNERDQTGFMTGATSVDEEEAQLLEYLRRTRQREWGDF